jgi:hypothetical protein
MLDGAGDGGLVGLYSSFDKTIGGEVPWLKSLCKVTERAVFSLSLRGSTSSAAGVI